MNTTMKKISVLLSLSISTVSRALKNHPDISISTKAKVKELADMLDYEPNRNAINLRSNNSRVFGLLVPSVSKFFYGSFMAAIEEECARNGYSLMIMQSNDLAEIEQDILKTYKQSRVSGVFVCLSSQTKDIAAFKKLKELSIPVVFFDMVPEDENDCIKVCSDDILGAEKAAAAMIKKDKKNILAIMGNKNLSITKQRIAGLNNFFDKEKNRNLFIEHADNPEEAKSISYTYLSKENNPDCIFCMSDEILTGTMKTVQELKISYPSSLGIISMSDRFFSKLYYPEITYIETSGYKLGKLAYPAMMNCLLDINIIQHLYLAPTFIDAGSL